VNATRFVLPPPVLACAADVGHLTLPIFPRSGALVAPTSLGEVVQTSPVAVASLLPCQALRQSQFSTSNGEWCISPIKLPPPRRELSRCAVENDPISGSLHLVGASPPVRDQRIFRGGTRPGRGLYAGTSLRWLIRQARDRVFTRSRVGAYKQQTRRRRPQLLLTPNGDTTVNTNVDAAATATSNGNVETNSYARAPSLPRPGRGRRRHPDVAVNSLILQVKLAASLHMVSGSGNKGKPIISSVN